MRNLQFPELPRQWSSHGYEIDELLGQGSYGAVYRMVRNKGTDQEEYWALKVIEKNLTKKRIRFQYRNDIAAARRDFGKEFNKLAREVNILESFMDVQIKGSCLEKMPEENYWRAYIQMEYLTELMDYAYPEEEDLESSNLESSDSQNQDFKFTEERMNQEEIIRLGIEICQALEVCHKENVLHRDIKPENIMVAKDGTFKLGDFGLAREWDDGSMTVIGTRNYMAPEVYNTFYDKFSDKQGQDLLKMNYAINGIIISTEITQAIENFTIMLESTKSGLMLVYRLHGSSTIYYTDKGKINKY